MSTRHARLLALENRVFGLVLPDVSLRVRAAEEALWQAWMTGGTDETPPASGPIATSACGDPIDATLPVSDWYYGASSVSYQGLIGGEHTWLGTKQVTTPVGGSCGSVSTTILYKLTVFAGSGSPEVNLYVLYESGGSRCPIAGTFPLGYTFNTTQTMGGVTSYSCSPFQASVATSNAAGLYDVSGIGTITIG